MAETTPHATSSTPKIRAKVDLASSSTLPGLDRTPGGSNWVTELPAPLRTAWHRSWIYRAAKHLAAEKGMTVGRAIAVAVNAARRGCSSGDLNFKGLQQVNAKSRAEMCAAVATWNAMKAASKKADLSAARALEVVELAAADDRNAIELAEPRKPTLRDKLRYAVFGPDLT